MSRLESLNKYSQRNFGLDLNGGLRVATGIDKDINGISQELFGRDANASFADLKTLMGGRVLSLPGVTGSALTAASNAAFDIVGDIDLRIELVGAPNFTGGNLAMISHSLPSTNWTYEWRIALTGANQFVYSVNGSTALTQGLGTSHFGGMRVTRVAATGVITYFLAQTLSGPWVQISQDTGTIGNLFDPVTPPVLRIGARADAAISNAYSGLVTRAEVRAGIDGTVVANPDFRFLAPGTPAYTDDAGRAWTFNGSAVIV